MVSVIIPTYNEEKALPTTLNTVLLQKGEYEVIVADGGSSDHTRDIVESAASINFTTAPKGRAVQMNAAVEAGCEYLRRRDPHSCIEVLSEALEAVPAEIDSPEAIGQIAAAAESLGSKVSGSVVGGNFASPPADGAPAC